ncbi:glycosyltransferase [Flavobacterium suncheonense]|uniref:glycosyltransferase n=1 Tax=Flavobacterium suncheonense TaxID=350894 RepID=UPI003FA37C94
MRIEYNPHKDKKQEKTSFAHQIIIPVFIPNEEGYYKDAFKILNCCIESVLKTVHNNTFISVVNNGSCLKVEQYLENLLSENKIHELIHTANIGKVNSILKALVGNNIELVTIADSDVLFCSNWQKKTIEVFNHFPKTGVVGLTPQFKMFTNKSSNVIFETFFSNKVRFHKVSDPKALELFYESIGWDKKYNKDYLRYSLTIFSEDFKALIGSGHYVATYRKEMFDNLKIYFDFKMGGGSEAFLDEVPLKKGLWRLTTHDNNAYHMGNVYEEWMGEYLDGLERTNDKESYSLKTATSFKNRSAVEYFIKVRLMSKLLSSNTFKRMFYILKGLPKEALSKY